MAELSIITINLNNREGLEKTLNSVFEQSIKSFEYIVIDGGSNDGSKELIANHQTKFTYWLSEPDRGIYEAMNKGIERANGKYLLFLNSGDFFTDNKVLQQVATAIKKDKSDIFYTDIIINNRRKTYPQQISLSFLFKTSLCHQSTLIKRSIFREFGLYDLRYNLIADWYLLIKSYFAHKSFTYIPDVVLTNFDNTGISASCEMNQAQRKKALAENYPHLLKDMNDFEALAYFRSSRVHKWAEKLKELIK